MTKNTRDVSRSDAAGRDLTRVATRTSYVCTTAAAAAITALTHLFHSSLVHDPERALTERSTLFVAIHRARLPRRRRRHRPVRARAPLGVAV